MSEQISVMWWIVNGMASFELAAVPVNTRPLGRVAGPFDTRKDALPLYDQLQTTLEKSQTYWESTFQSAGKYGNNSVDLIDESENGSDGTG